MTTKASHVKRQMHPDLRHEIVHVSSRENRHRKSYERPPKPPTIRNSCTRTLILDTIMKLSGTIGVTQKTMTFDYTCLPVFEFWRHSSSKLISARNEASKSIQKLCAKSKRYHAENEHASIIRKWKAAQNDDQNDDWTMTIFLISWVPTDTSPQRELQNDFLAGKKLFLFHCCCCFFFCCCLFLLLLLLLLLTSCPQHQTLRNDGGHTKNDDHFSHVLSRM